MDIKKVIKLMQPLILETKNLPKNHPEYGKDHLLEMCDKISTDIIIGEKAHRWVGYIQGCVCSYGGTNLKTLKLINKTEKGTK